MIKRILLIAMLITLFIFFSKASLEAPDLLDQSSRDYFLRNTFKETGSRNFVTGIYLDYRLFDTIFEASILIIAVSGIIFMSKRDDEIL